MAFQYKYPRPAVSVDICTFRIRDSKTELLLIIRKNDPFGGCWALPGGFVDENETLEQAAGRELREETGLVAEDVRQVKAYSDPGRDPRTRVISFAFAAHVAADAIAKAADDAQDVRWFPLNKPLPPLAFDHEQIIADAIAILGL